MLYTPFKLSWRATAPLEAPHTFPAHHLHLFSSFRQRGHWTWINTTFLLFAAFVRDKAAAQAQTTVTRHSSSDALEDLRLTSANTIFFARDTQGMDAGPISVDYVK
jgi:hypothetical protein